MRVLVVEDSVRLQRSLTIALREAGYAVDVTGDGRDGLWRAQSEDYAVVILDLMLPGLDGMSVLRQLREKERETKVLILTAKDAVADRVAGLDQGADDYLVKPFALDEFLARVRALSRRRFGTSRSRIEVEGLTIDLARRKVERGGRELELARREYMLLEYLGLRLGEVASREEIEAHLYDASSDPVSNVVEAAICRLRRKVDVSGCVPLIHTRRGMGYWLGPAP
jgi:DNA-binding response OmpR family regulator